VFLSIDYGIYYGSMKKSELGLNNAFGLQGDFHLDYLALQLLESLV